MPRNGNGTYTRPVADYEFDTVISETDVNTEMDDIAAALTDSLVADGQRVPTANLPMDGFRHTGVGNGSARTDYTAMGQVQDGKANWADAGGTGDTITVAYSPAVMTLVDGQLAFVRAMAANATATPTLSLNGLTPRIIVKQGGSALVAGDIAGDGHELVLRYDLNNTRWELLNPLGTKVPSLQVGSPTGGDKGSGTINAVAIYNDGSQIHSLAEGLQTPWTSTSGTSHDWNGIRSDAHRITILYDLVSTNGSSPICVQIGSGTISNSGYGAIGYTLSGVPAIGIQSQTAGFPIHQGAVAANTFTGRLVLELLNASTNTWIAICQGQDNTNGVLTMGTGSKALSGILDRVRVTTIGGTDTFDAGTVNLLVE